VIIPTVQVDVEILDGDKRPINKIRGRDATYKETYYMKDEFKTILGDGQARVSVGLDEKIGGRNYSSAAVRVNVTLSCDQSADTIKKATEMAFNTAAEFLDTHLPPAVRLLDQHISDIFGE
jgi:hypothetical protein